MNLTVERKALADALPRALAVVDRKGTIPVLEHFLLTAEVEPAPGRAPGGLHVAATDMDRRVELQVAARVEAPGKACVPARLLSDAVKSLPEGSEIRIALDAAGDRVTVAAGRSRFRLPVLPPEEFPAFEAPDVQGFAIPARDLLKLIERTAHAMSSEETRYYLCGIYLHPAATGTSYGATPADDTYGADSVLRAVATTGHVLARADVGLPIGAEAIPHVIVPRQMVEVLRDWMKAAPPDAEASLSVTDRLIRCEADWLGAGVSSKLVDGTFPDYQRVIPHPSVECGGTRFTVAADDLVAAVRRAQIAALSTKTGRAIKLDVRQGGNRPEVRVLGASETHAEAESAVDVELEGKPLEVGFNAAYLADTVIALGCDTVTIDTADAGSPTRIESPADDSVLAVVMPMRV